MESPPFRHGVDFFPLKLWAGHEIDASACTCPHSYMHCTHCICFLLILAVQEFL
jgi:hypothetical protein